MIFKWDSGSGGTSRVLLDFCRTVCAAKEAGSTVSLSGVEAENRADLFVELLGFISAVIKASSVCT